MTTTDKIKIVPAMLHRHYIKRQFLKPAYLFFTGILLVFLTFGLSFLIAPSTLLIEAIVFILFGGGLLLIGASVPKYTRYAMIVAGWLVVILLLRRFDALSWISFALSLIGVGVITLLN